MEIKSSAFSNGETIPIRYTGEGSDVSPRIEWSHIPPECKGLAIICEDPDAPKSRQLGHPFIHWLAYNIPCDVLTLPEDIDKIAEVDTPYRFEQGLNSFGEIGYSGPLPPRGDGPHRYFFTLLALDVTKVAPAGADYIAVSKNMNGHILKTAQLMGVFHRGAPLNDEIPPSIVL